MQWNVTREHGDVILDSLLLICKFMTHGSLAGKLKKLTAPYASEPQSWPHIYYHIFQRISLLYRYQLSDRGRGITFQDWGEHSRGVNTNYGFNSFTH